jgi:hypothetical protein
MLTNIGIGKAKRYNLKIKYYYNLLAVIMSRSNSRSSSRSNSRSNSIDLSRSRTSSWENRRSNSLGSVETIEFETDKTIKNVSNVTNIKTTSMKIIPSNREKKRARDVYIDIHDPHNPHNPHKNPTPTPNSFLEKYMKSDLVWMKTKYK